MAPKPRPNVLWLMSDQHHASCMGHAGRAVHTPNLDAIAARGVSFSQAFCNNPICAPSRITFLTGQYPRTHRHLGNNIFDYDQTNPNTLSALARRHGYQTALIGKAHMIRAWDEEGFEHLRYCDLIDADRNDPTTHHYFRYLIDHGLAEAYEYGTLPDDHRGAHTRPFVSDIPHEHGLEVWTGNETLAFLEGRDRRRPFFVQMTFQRPHPPWSVCPSCADLYDPDEIELPASARELLERGFAGKPAFQRARASQPGKYGTPVDEADLRHRLTFYYALISSIDAQVGRVIDHLRETGDLENTVIAYVADHGDFAGDHGMTYKNMGIYESIHRIPFLLSYPGGPQGRVVDELVESVDLYPTLCQLMDVEAPNGVEGSSLLPVAEGRAPGKDAIVCEWSWMQPAQLIYAVRTEDYRMVYYGRDLAGELYDRRTDPDELENVYDNPAYAGVRLALLERILDHAKAYERHSDLQKDAVIAHRTRNMPTRLVQFGKKTWSEVEH